MPLTTLPSRAPGCCASLISTSCSKPPKILARVPQISRERLMILTNGGGAGVLAADRVADFHGELAPLGAATRAALDKVLPATWSKGNPVDIVADADPERYVKALEILLADQDNDALLILNCPTALSSSTAVAQRVVETIRQDRQRNVGQAGVDQLAWHLGGRGRAPAICLCRSANLRHARRSRTRLHAHCRVSPDAGRADARAGCT